MYLGKGFYNADSWSGWVERFGSVIGATKSTVPILGYVTCQTLAMTALHLERLDHGASQSDLLMYFCGKEIALPAWQVRLASRVLTRR